MSIPLVISSPSRLIHRIFCLRQMISLHLTTEWGSTSRPHRPTSTASLVQQEGLWIKPQSLTTRHVLIMEILQQNAQH